MAIVWDEQKSTTPGTIVWDEPSTPSPVATPSTGGLSEALSKRGANIAQRWAAPADESVMGSVMNAEDRLVGTAGQLAGGVNDIVGAGLKGAYGMLPDGVRGFIGDRTKAVVSGFADAPLIRQGATTMADLYAAAEKRYPKQVQRAEDVLNIAGVVPMGWAGKKAASATADAAMATKNAFYPKPTSEEALRQILQAARGTNDPTVVAKRLSAGESALGRIDLKGVNTYNGIRTKLDESIPALSRSVDDILNKDTTLYKLDDLSTKQPVQDIMQGGQAIAQAPVEVNFINDAIDQLGQYYGKVGQKGKAADMANTLERATTEGLTKKEVNDIARKYNIEFSDKSFNKNGELLNSITAGQHETIRSGVKEVARRGMPAEAAEIDGMMSNIYKTRELVSKNEVAIQRLKDTYKERGLGEKLVSHALVLADLATLGTVKGALLKLAPRNMGLKTRNWADIEGKLSRNLSILEKANAAKTGEEMANILRQNMSLRQPPNP
jgi:hypothetical protein